MFNMPRSSILTDKQEFNSSQGVRLRHQGDRTTQASPRSALKLGNSDPPHRLSTSGGPGHPDGLLPVGSSPPLSSLTGISYLEIDRNSLTLQYTLWGHIYFGQ